VGEKVLGGLATSIIGIEYSEVGGRREQRFYGLLRSV